MSRRMLLVHELKVIHKIVKSYIHTEMTNLEVAVAGSASQGLEMMRGEEFDLVLTQLEMRGMGAEEMLRRMDEDPEIDLPPVLVMSSSLTGDKRRWLAERGIRHAIATPFTPQELQAAVEEALNPRANRSHSRFSIVGARALIELASHTVEARLINLSKGGFLCDMPRPKDAQGILDKVLVTLLLPEDYDGVRVPDAPALLVRLTVTGRHDDHTPSRLQAAWTFAGLSPHAAGQLAKVLDKAGRELQRAEDQARRARLRGQGQAGGEAR